MRQGAVDCCQLKFLQNKWLWGKLKALGDEVTIAYCGKRSGKWGTGLQLDDPDLHDQSNWGPNKLGRLLNEIKEKGPVVDKED